MAQVHRYNDDGKRQSPPPSAFPPLPPSRSGWSGELLRLVPAAHITNLRHPTLTSPPPTPIYQFAPTRFGTRGVLSCFLLPRSPESSSEDGVSNSCRCHGQVSSLAACGPLERIRVLTACSSGTGYSKLGTSISSILLQSFLLLMPPRFCRKRLSLLRLPHCDSFQGPGSRCRRLWIWSTCRRKQTLLPDWRRWSGQPSTRKAWNRGP